MSDKLSDKDKKDWENFLSNKEVLKDKDSLELKEKVIKTQSFDLHGFTLDEANKEIKVLSAEEVKSSYEKGDITLIDIRDIRELEKEGRVENANHIPRGMLEFWLDPDSIYFKKGKLDLNKEMVLFCAGGLRSALAAKSLKDMGFKKVSHIEGGFGAIKQSKFKIV